MDLSKDISKSLRKNVNLSLSYEKLHKLFLTQIEQAQTQKALRINILANVINNLEYT